MPRRLAASLAATVILVAGCAGAASPPRSTTSPVPATIAPSATTSAAPSSAAAAPSAASTRPSWLRLGWESVTLPNVPGDRYRTNVLRSARGTLLRILADGGSPTVSILITRDGRTWETSTAPTADTPLGRSLDGGTDWLQVMVPEKDGMPLDLLTSSDGRSWHLVARLPNQLKRVSLSAIRGRTIVACGAARETSVSVETCASSTDGGATWRHLPELDTLIGSGQLLGVHATPAGFLLVLTKVVGPVVKGASAASPDGVSWSVGPEAPGLEGLSPDIGARAASIGDTHVISGAILDGREYIRGLWSSQDGRSWQRVATPRVVAWAGELEPIGGGLLSLVKDGRGDDMHYVGVQVSADGTTWRADTLPSEFSTRRSIDWLSVPVPDGLLLLEHASGAGLLGRLVPAVDPGPAPGPSSTPVPEPLGPLPPQAVWRVGSSAVEGRASDVVAWDGGYVAVGTVEDGVGKSTGVVWASGDGLSWTKTAVLPSGSMRAVTTDGEVLVAAGHATGVTHGGETQNPVAAFWRSRDGRTWERAPDQPELVIGAAPFEDSWWTGLNGLVAGGPGFVAVGATRAGGATVWTSVDGLGWRRSATLGDATMLDVVVGGPGLVATGATGGPHSEGRVWTSRDGITWTAATGLPPGELSTLAGQGRILVGAGWGPTVWQSQDGLSWTSAPDQTALRRRINDEGIWAVVGTPGAFVGVGAAACPDALEPCAAAWTSADGLRWERTQLPTASRVDPICPSCALVPTAAVEDRGTIVAVGTTGPAGQAWTSWVGTLRP